MAFFTPVSSALTAISGGINASKTGTGEVEDFVPMIFAPFQKLDCKRNWASPFAAQINSLFGSPAQMRRVVHVIRVISQEFGHVGSQTIFEDIRKLSFKDSNLLRL
jgi:hypothetical protein